MKIILMCAVLTLALFGSGCASIMDGGDSKSLSIKTNPAGAKVTVKNMKGDVILYQTTPAIFSLKRDQEYNLTLELTDYYPTEMHVKSVLDGWYIGNLIFGGPLGMLIDPGTGAMWTLNPRDITWNFVSNAVPLTPEELKAAELKANPPPVVKNEHPGKSAK